VDAVEDPFECIVTGDSLGESEKAPQPVFPLPGEGIDLLLIIRTADDGADGDSDDVEQQVARGTAGILELAKVSVECQAGHDAPP
jgi:hypothetical protein